jgi:hypothetical protein
MPANEIVQTWHLVFLLCQTFVCLASRASVESDSCLASRASVEWDSESVGLVRYEAWLVFFFLSSYHFFWNHKSISFHVWVWFELHNITLALARALVPVVYQRSKRSFSVFVQNWHAVYMFGHKLSRVDLTTNSMGWIKAHLMRPISGHFSKCLNKTDH